MKYNLIVTFDDNDYSCVFQTLKSLVDDYMIPEQFDSKEALRERTMEFLKIAIVLEDSDQAYILRGVEVYVLDTDQEYAKGFYSSVYFQTDLEGESHIYIS